VDKMEAAQRAEVALVEHQTFVWLQPPK